MTLPAWAEPECDPITVTLPAVSQRWLRRADDLLEMWGRELRGREAEVDDATRNMGNTIGRVEEQGPYAACIPVHNPGLSIEAQLCDRIVATLKKRQQKALRLAYKANCSPQTAVIVMRCENLSAYWAEVDSAKCAVAVRLEQTLDFGPEF